MARSHVVTLLLAGAEMLSKSAPVSPLTRLADTRSEISPRPALVLVRNSVTHDARVLREARLLQHLGLVPRVVGVTSNRAPEAVVDVEGIRVERLSPTSPMALARRLLGRRVSSDRPEATASGNPETSPAAGTRATSAGRALVRVHRWLVTLDYYRRGFGVVLRRRPTLVHCNDYNTMWIGVSARLLGSAVVYDAHELWPDRNLRPEPRWWLLACEALFVRVAHRVITTSPEYARVIAWRYRVHEPVVVRNIPPVEREGQHMSEDRERSTGDAEREGQPLAIYVGALTRNRGLEESIDVLARLPNVRLRLVGPASSGYRARLEAMADRLGVGSRLEVADPVSPSEVVEAIRGADVGLALIQPACLSYELTLPNKLFEYVAAGVPVLGSDLPAIADFIETRGVGLVTDPLDPDRTAEALREILRPERSADFREAAQRAAADETWGRESTTLARVYIEALEASRG